MEVDYSDYSDSDYEASRSSLAKIAAETSSAGTGAGSSESKEPQPVSINDDKASRANSKNEPESQSESDTDGPPKKMKKPNSPLDTPLLNLFLTSPQTERTAAPPSPSAMAFSNTSPLLPPRTPTPPSRAPIIVTSKNVATAIAMAMEQTSGKQSSGGKDGSSSSCDNISLDNINLNPLVPNGSQAPAGSVQSSSSSGVKSVIVRAGPSTQNTVCAI